MTRLALSYLPDVCAYVRRLGRGSPDCDDLVQDVFERAFGSLGDLDDPASCRPWLLRIARNRVIDWQRARSARPELRLLEPGDSPAPEPSVSPERVERADAAALEAALATLSPELRDAVLLSDVWGCAYAEIAVVLDIPIGTVRSRIARARSRLAVALASDGEGTPRRASAAGDGGSRA
jgi:RNA polymerase sigma-70 factor (ECF subfamily)